MRIIYDRYPYIRAVPEIIRYRQRAAVWWPSLHLVRKFPDCQTIGLGVLDWSLALEFQIRLVIVQEVELWLLLWVGVWSELYVIMFSKTQEVSELHCVCVCVE